MKKLFKSTLILLSLVTMAGNAFASSVLKKDSDASVNLRIDPKAREVLFFKSLDGKESLIFKGAFGG